VGIQLLLFCTFESNNSFSDARFKTYNNTINLNISIIQYYIIIKIQNEYYNNVDTLVVFNLIL